MPIAKMSGNVPRCSALSKKKPGAARLISTDLDHLKQFNDTHGQVVMK